jgi:NADH-quinone oxidoreductase subunit F
VPDLKYTLSEPDEEEKRLVQALTQNAQVPIRGDRVAFGGVRRAKNLRNLLLPGLHALQNAKGWISPGGLNHLAETLRVPAAEAFGVASFYDLFTLEEPAYAGPLHHVCVDPSCGVAGAEARIKALQAQGKAVHEGPCLGQCDRAPAYFVQARSSEPVDMTALDNSKQAFDTSLSGKLLRRFGKVDPSDLRSYLDNGGYRAFETALSIGGAAVISRITEAGLTGRGGAAFPTGVKWNAVAAHEAYEKHIVVNADESEPGTFKDRMILENDPFALIEAMTIAAVSTGSTKGWIYVRGEYATAERRLQSALNEVQRSGLLGHNIRGTDHSFDIQIRQGAGAYICGEETALFNSIEGFRGEPRSKPPFPTESGLFRSPTIVNNPETLINVLEILEAGVDEFRASGTNDSPGTKLFCVSGDIGTPGLYEAEFGTPLRRLLEAADIPAEEVYAVLLGGAAGRFLNSSAIDMPLSFEGAKAYNATLGSGAVMVFSNRVDLTKVVTRLGKFFKDESCGQCVPCRIGTQRQHEVLLQIGDSTPTRRQRDLLDDLSIVMGDASICGLGHTAASAVQSAIDQGLIWSET